MEKIPKKDIIVPFKLHSKEERETSIVKTDADNTWSLYTSRPATYRDLISKGHTPVRVDKNGAFFEMRHITLPSYR
jgi:hypothetical protein